MKVIVQVTNQSRKNEKIPVRMNLFLSSTALEMLFIDLNNR